MTSTYNFSGTFPLNGSITAEVTISLTVEDNTNLITAATGNITYSSTYSDSQIFLLSPNVYNGNDNILASLTTPPYFTQNGTAFVDSPNNIEFSFYFATFANQDYVLNSQAVSNNFGFISESLSLPCLLSNTNILTNEGLIQINQLNENHIIISENKKHKIKRIMSTNINLIEREMPYRLPSGMLGCNEDLYLSQGHAIKVGNNFFLPEHLNLTRLSIEEFLELKEDKYYHIELECLEGENRRTNTLNANGVTVESYSSDEIPW